MVSGSRVGTGQIGTASGVALASKLLRFSTLPFYGDEPMGKP